MNRKILYLLIFVFMVGVVSAGNITYYNFEDNVNDIWSSNDGSNTGVTYSTSYPTYNSSGDGSNKSGEFGSGDYIDTNIIIGSGNAVTVSVWSKRSNLASNDDELFGSIRDNSFSGWGCWLTTTTEFMCFLRFTDNSDSGNLGLFTWDDTNWHHFVFTDDGTTTTKMYFDGVEVVNYDHTGKTRKDLQELWIGNRYLYTSHYWDGFIDEFQYYDEVLTEDQIINIYNYGTITAPVTSYTIQGYVLRGDGNPVQNANVVVVDQSSPFSVIGTTTSGQDGNWSLASVSAGTYTVYGYNSTYRDIKSQVVVS